LILNADSEEQCVSDDSDTELLIISEETDNSVPKYQLWHDSRSQDRNKIYHFGAPKPGVYCNAVLHMSVNSSPLDYFDRVKFLLPTTHSRIGGQNSITRYFYS
jgi:hypothetical protein